MDAQQQTKILIIDDEAFFRQGICSCLEDLGFKVIEAENGSQGLDRVKTDAPDLVLLDLRLPRMDGLEVLGILTGKFPDLPVVVVSGTGSMESLARALNLGAWDYIFKPVNDDRALTHSIEKCLEKSRLIQENKAYQENLEALVQARTQALYQSEARYRAVFEFTATAVAIIEADGCITMANSWFARLVGQDKAAIEGRKNWNDFMASHDIDAMRNHLESLTEESPADPAVFRYEVQLQCATGEVKSVYASLGRILGSSRYVVSLVDITDKKQAEHRWQELEKQLRNAQKMEAIGTLAAGIAHDMNNILSPVLGYADMIMREVDPQSRVFARCEKIQKAAYRGAELVGQVLAFNQGDNEEKRLIRLGPVLREAVRFLKRSIPATIKISYEMDRDCDAVLADPARIFQVVMNLCTNAYQAMEGSGGKLGLTLRQVVLDPETVFSHPSLGPGKRNYLEIQVTDTGHGMAEDIQELIFNPYFTTKEEGRGSGLGLPTAYSIIRDCRGDIQVESTPGKGSCFTVLIPGVEKKDPILRKTGVPHPDAFLPARIMVVDDEVDIAQMCKEGLEGLGFEVDAFSSGDESLAFFKAHKEDIDLVLTDQVMPEMTGLELVREIRAIRPGIPIILCTGFFTGPGLDQLREKGVSKLVKKPVSVDVLADEIAKVLEGTADRHKAAKVVSLRATR